VRDFTPAWIVGSPVCAGKLNLAAFCVRDIRSLSQLRIGLGEKVLSALCVPAKLSVVGSLGVLDLLVGADYILLGGTQIAMPVAYVHDWGLHINNVGLLYVFDNLILGECHSTTKQNGRSRRNKKLLGHHGISPYR
jgi:hypothetical protein